MGNSGTTETITVRMTKSGDTTEVTVLHKRPERIQVVLGKGVHSVQCDLVPTRNGLAYSGEVMGREIVYECSAEQVKADLDRLDPRLKQYRPGR